MKVYNFDQYLSLLNESMSNSQITSVVGSVISDHGSSKKYNHLFEDHLGFTAVGILHFTKSGLGNLYEVMDTVKYFGKSSEEMIASIKTYKGHEMRNAEWKKGMEAFLASPESIKVQDSAAIRKFKPYLDGYVKHWTTERENAIGISIINSSSSTFKSLGKKYNWDAEKMMFGYCKIQSDKHVAKGKAGGRCRTRCRKIGKYYPYSGDITKYYFKGCEDLIDSNGVAVTTAPWDDLSNKGQTEVPAVNSQNVPLDKSMSEIQQRLVDLGYYLGTYGPNGDGVDGKRGKLTRAAVEDFQENNLGLVVDGDPGTNTQAVLFSSEAVAQLKNQDPDNTPIKEIKPVLLSEFSLSRGPAGVGSPATIYLVKGKGDKIWKIDSVPTLNLIKERLVNKEYLSADDAVGYVKTGNGPFEYSSELSKAKFSNLEGVVTKDNYKKILGGVTRKPSESSSAYPPMKERFKAKKPHHGYDISADKKIFRKSKLEVPLVVCAKKGVVTDSLFSKSYGNFVEIKHGENDYSAYGHLDSSNVKKGDTINVGDVIGVEGTTGHSGGDHVHFEFRVKRTTQHDRYGEGAPDVEANKFDVIRPIKDVDDYYYYQLGNSSDYA
jgi:murein DD-endopeptidase MepM/ murein hydrolase activator NlpD